MKLGKAAAFLVCRQTDRNTEDWVRMVREMSAGGWLSKTRIAYCILIYIRTTCMFYYRLGLCLSYSWFMLTCKCLFIFAIVIFQLVCFLFDCFFLQFWKFFLNKEPIMLKSNHWPQMSFIWPHIINHQAILVFTSTHMLQWAKLWPQFALAISSYDILA